MLKRVLWAVLIVGVFVVLIVPGVLKEQVRKALTETFPGARVSVGSLGIEMPPAVSLSNVHIRHKTYDMTIRKILMDRQFRLTLLEPTAALQAPLNMSVASESKGQGSARPEPGAFAISSISARGIQLKYAIDGITAVVTGDLVYDPRNERFTLVALDVSSLRRGDLELKDGRVDIGSEGLGEVRVASISQQKVKLTDVRAAAHLSRSTLILSDVEALLSAGRVRGSVRVEFIPKISYAADLTVRLLDLSILAKDLGIEPKVGLGGLLDGKITLSGDAADMRELTGELRGTDKGGDVVIQDRATLEHLAKNIGQPPDLVEAAFKEYHFDTGRVTLELTGNDLGLKVYLEGVKGKRDLEIKLHDIL